MNVGYYKVWRKATEGKLWNAKPYDPWHAFEYLIARAAWKDHEVWYQTTAIQLHRGQLATTERQLARDWGWGRCKVKTFLKSLQQSDMIQTAPKQHFSTFTPKLNQQSASESATNQPRYMIITVSNYETYQGNGEEPDHKSATASTENQPQPSQCPATDQPQTSQCPATREEVKKNRQEGNKNAAPAPPPLTAAPAPQNGTQQPDGPTANDDPPVPDSAVEHFNAGRLREALTDCVDAGCYYNARRLAMKLGDLKEMERITKKIEEVRNEAQNEEKGRN